MDLYILYKIDYICINAQIIFVNAKKCIIIKYSFNNNLCILQFILKDTIFIF